MNGEQYLVAVTDVRNKIYWMTMNEMNRCLHLSHEGGLRAEAATTILPFMNYVLQPPSKDCPHFLIKMDCSDNLEWDIAQAQSNYERFVATIDTTGGRTRSGKSYKSHKSHG
jgi:hypothetical protein